MTKLPKRTRAHQLEEESIREFRSLLPSTWVYRTPERDYGIDGEVEIFEEDGAATGRKFLVQLKATDEKNIKKALKLRLNIATANYFDRLEEPVLVVRYLANTKSTYCRWFHSFDPYWEKIAEKSIAFNFSERDAWGTTEIHDILEDVSAFYQLKSKHPFPINIPVLFTDDCALNNWITNFFASAIGGARKYVDYFTLSYRSDWEKLPPTYILFDKEKLHIVLARKTGFCIHFPEGINEETRNEFVSNLFVGIGISLFRMNFITPAAILLYKNLLKSSLKHEPKAVLSCVISLTKSNMLNESVKLTEHLFDEDEGINIGQLSIATLLKNFKDKNLTNTELISSALNKISHSLQARRIYTVAGAIEYTHGNFLRTHTPNIKSALSHYKLAASLNSTYKAKPYWYSEVAACLFLLERYYFSSLFYKRALNIGAEPAIKALYADALFYSRKFSEALKEMDAFLSESTDDKANLEWKLKSMCLDMLVNGLGIHAQSPPQITYDIEQLIQDNDDESIINYLKENDALYGEAWFTLGSICVNQERYTDAAGYFVMSAFTGNDPVESWLSAIASAWKAGDSQVLTAIMMCAYEKFGQDIILDFINTRLSKQDGGDIKSQLALVEMIEFFNSLGIDNKPMTFRVLKPDEHHQE